MCKLVMIDDNPIEHLIMQRLLDRYGIFKDAVHSLDGRIIIEFLREKNAVSMLPDLIFLDLDMPGFSGWDFLEQFEKLYLRLAKPISVYVVSSSVCDEERSRSAHFPFVKEFISKPVTKDKLEILYCLHYIPFAGDR
ncbi:response regulator [Mucilaginibacter aquariorum]|uniref:Response regulator n=1 Tax=Mucilaginibacter aquariorum TaxID=2967225 RepID=A0ABT1SW49_9SPHI|nr:response regulator [Mucilaginibacter aquariorum]MCQ6956331.1 response regulator [Mucilaginibacter aquariorum]